LKGADKVMDSLRPRNIPTHLDCAKYSRISSAEYLQNYIDYDAIARDMMINGEIAELEGGLIVTNANEF